MNFILKLHFGRFACLAVIAGTALFAGRATAQSAADAAKIAASLPSDAQTAIERLSSLRELPDAAWKLHSGDLAHGEALNLDESGWQPIAMGTLAPKDAVWFRQTYQVPATLNGYDLTGARIWFQFHAYANGPMPEILYFYGRRVAMGDDLEPVPLFESARPGDKVTETAVGITYLYPHYPFLAGDEGTVGKKGKMRWVTASREAFQSHG